MDGVLVDFTSGIKWGEAQGITVPDGQDWGDIPHIFGHMVPMPGAIEAFHRLCENPKLEVHILSTAPWENDTAWSDKARWVKKYLGEAGKKRLTLSHHKNIAHGRWLVDDRIKNGVAQFTGEHIHFGTDAFPSWGSVVAYVEANLT